MSRRLGVGALLSTAFAVASALPQTQPSTARVPGASPVVIHAVPLKNDARITVKAMQPWTDTGILLRRGDSVRFTASGMIAFANGRSVSAEGSLRGWRDMLRMFPVDTAPAGALVGRIGDQEASVPFVVGQSSSLEAAHEGRLYVRCNTSDEAPATGSFQLVVQVKRAALPPYSPAIQPGAVLPLADLEALPRRVADAASNPGDVLNFAMLGTEEQVRSALQSAGWVPVDADVPSAVLHGLLSTLEHKPYLEVPMSPLYLFGRVQDLSYARASAITVARERHHLRCWRTGVEQNGVPLWIGAATHDIGFERDRRNGQMTHRIVPEIDLERDFLRDSLLGSGAASDVTYFTPQKPVHKGQTATGGPFVTDGRILTMRLR